MKEKFVGFLKTNKTEIITITLMIVIGTCMHFVTDIFDSQTAKNVLGVVFPVNETSWEHMKMLWWPFMVAGIILSLKKKDCGYFGGFVLAGFLSMLTMIGLFAFYQSFTGTSVLALDIPLFMVNIILCAMLGFHFAKLDWVKKGFIAWFIFAILITAGLITLTYVHGDGYLFLDDEGLE
jgi:hypothetical protein